MMLNLVKTRNDCCSACGGRLDRLSALVAFSDVSSNAVVVAASKHIICDMREGGIDAGDVFGSDEGGSIQVWEGTIVVSVTPSSPNGPEEYDADYVGSFRDPTSEELNAVLRGENPFTTEEQSAELDVR